MNTLTEAIAALKLSEQSCREEASGKLDDSHSVAEGMKAIETNLKDVRRFLSRLNCRQPVFLSQKQRAALHNLAGAVERDDLIAALESNQQRVR